MKKFNVKSFVAGILVGAMGLSTAFAATGIKSAILSDTTVTLKGASLSLDKPMILVTMDDEQTPVQYMPAEEILGKLGYDVHYDKAKNTIDLIPGKAGPGEAAKNASVLENEILNLANHPGQKNIAESGAFQAGENQTLVLTITSDIKGGTVDLFLFDPNGKEQHIIIGSEDMIKEIPLEKGTWQYNCSGMFKEGGNVKITGTIK